MIMLMIMKMMMTKTDEREQGKVHFVASQCPHSGCWYWIRWSFFLPSLKIECTLVIFVKLMLQHFVQFGQSVIQFFNIFRWFVWIVASIFYTQRKILDPDFLKYRAEGRFAELSPGKDWNDSSVRNLSAGSGFFALDPSNSARPRLSS